MLSKDIVLSMLGNLDVAALTTVHLTVVVLDNIFFVSQPYHSFFFCTLYVVVFTV